MDEPQRRGHRVTPAFQPGPPSAAARLTVAVVICTIAFACYTTTLLPGVDLGDTAAFQAAVAWPKISARQAYPLYFGLAKPFVVVLTPGDPARGANLFSAVWGAVAAGALAWVAANLAGSLIAGAAGGLLLAFSYTVWTQAVIAEVYTLHLALIALLLAAFGFWERTRSFPRLALLCALYALAFGNHLSTILLLPPLAAGILLAHPEPRRLLRPSVLAAGLAIAAVGALQYVPNLLALWSHIEAPDGWTARAAAFWFDVTKTDWRNTMLLGVAAGSVPDRLAMLVWDARQQFGTFGVALAALGVIALGRHRRPWAVLLTLGYLINTVFALTYNVGDAHVFLLPGHLFTALAAAAGVATLLRGAARLSSAAPSPFLLTVAAVSILLFVAWRGWTTLPAADRSGDVRAGELAGRTFLGLNTANALLVSRMTWDQENALLYASRYTQPDVAWVRAYDVLPHFQFLVRDNLARGRDVVLTADAAALVVAGFGNYFPLEPDRLPGSVPLSTVVERIPRGSPFVLTLLRPLREFPLDVDDVHAAMRVLGGVQDRLADSSQYALLAGIVGEPAVVHETSDRPFTLAFDLAGDQFQVRMDAWLPADTFRRGGFGHVLRGRQRLLFVERGLSLVWLDRDGRRRVHYAGGPYAAEPRYRISASAPGFAAAGRGAIAVREAPARHR